MLATFFKSYKTTLIGAVIAGLVALQTAQSGLGWKGYLSAFVIAAFGFVSKDFNASGTQK